MRKQLLTPIVFNRKMHTCSALAIALFLSPFSYGQKTNSENEQDLIAVLKSDAPGGDKAIACKRMAIYGTSEGVQDLASLLKDEKLASWARIALESIPGPAADEALLKATESLEGLLLVGTINSIGVRRDPAAVESLQKRLKDKDPEVASAAAVALGRIGNGTATQALSKSLADAPMQVRSAIGEGLVLCAERTWKEGNTAEAIELYDEVRKANLPKPRILEATRGAILARKTEGIPLLLEQLRSSDKAMLQIGLGTARELAGKEVDQALAAELEKSVPERAALIVRAMAERKETVDLDSILKVAKSGAKPVRLAAIDAISAVGNLSCVPSLLDIAIDSDAELAQSAKTALAKIPDDRLSADIQGRLSKAEGKLLAALIEVVGQRQINASDELIKALDSTDASVRKASLQSLGNIVPADKLSVLISQVTNPKKDDLAAAVLALKTASVRMPDRDECASKLAAAMGKSSTDTKLALLDILAAVGGTKALEAVGESAKSSDTQIKDVSSRLLGDWMTIDAAPVLLKLANEGPNDKFQVRAMRGYIRIARQFTMSPADRVEMCKKAMENAKQTAEKKLVVEIYKRNPSIEMLGLAIKAAENPELKGDAIGAAQAILAKLGDKADEGRAMIAKSGLELPKP